MPRGRKPKDEEEIDEINDSESESINDVERYTANKAERLKLVTKRYLLLLQREAMRWKEG